MEYNLKNLVLLTAIVFSITVTLFAWIAFDEWYTVKILKEQAEIDKYGFGIEEVIALNGWHYQSESTYARWNLFQGFSLFLVVFLAVYSAVRRNVWWLLTAGVLFLSLFFFWRWFLSGSQIPI